MSALDRVINTQESERINMFQIDAAVNEGNSGGPVYNGMGEVVGIVTAKYSSSGVEGLGFAIPINDVKAIADDLINIGYVTGKAYMGVSFDSRYNSMYSQYYGMPLGAYVGEVTPHTAAEKAGLKSGDIITAIGGYTVESYNDIKGALRHFSSGETFSPFNGAPQDSPAGLCAYFVSMNQVLIFRPTLTKKGSTGRVLPKRANARNQSGWMPRKLVSVGVETTAPFRRSEQPRRWWSRCCR